MYSCGPAAYRYAHVGNLRAYLLADLIRRNAEHRHHLAVLTCQNITAVGDLADEEAGEDKVLAEARAEGRTALELARVYEDAFRADCSALNLRPAEHSPRASEWTGLMIEMIAGLIEAGHAYPAPDGSVYFDARSFPSYGELSGNRLAELRAGAARGAGEAGRGGGAGKRFHADWALWKIGDVIDIHTGGIDLRFPHHEDERAQSDSVTGHEVVRHWVHGEHLLFDGRKMAKSAQNVVLVADLADRGLDPLALRLAFLEHRYRQQMNLTWDRLNAADRTLRRWRELVAEWACSPSKPVHGPVAAQIAAAFDDDLDTPAALRSLRQLEKDQDVPPGSKFESFAHADQLLGLDLAREVGR